MTSERLGEGVAAGSGFHAGDLDMMNTGTTCLIRSMEGSSASPTWLRAQLRAWWEFDAAQRQPQCPWR
jgi:hypothetical protein